VAETHVQPVDDADCATHEPTPSERDDRVVEGMLGPDMGYLTSGG
jgi:hypothetical protein